MDASAKADEVGSKADQSPILDHAVRAGLVSYGIVHLLIAWLAVRIAFGDSQGSASSQGALSELAKTGPGRISLYVVVVGFLALVVWQVLETILGGRDKEGAKQALYRLRCAAKAVVYAVLGISSLKVALGSGGGSGDTDSMTSKLMSAPGGQVLVGAVGLGVLAVAGAFVYIGFSESFMKKLNAGQAGTSGRALVLLGKAGYVSKGVAFVIVGILFGWAAVTHDAQKSGGLDQALHKVLQQPFGSPMLILIAIGIACYGLFCFAWARHLDR